MQIPLVKLDLCASLLTERNRKMKSTQADLHTALDSLIFWRINTIFWLFGRRRRRRKKEIVLCLRQESYQSKRFSYIKNLFVSFSIWEIDFSIFILDVSSLWDSLYHLNFVVLKNINWNVSNWNVNDTIHCYGFYFHEITKNSSTCCLFHKKNDDEKSNDVTYSTPRKKRQKKKLVIRG